MDRKENPADEASRGLDAKTLTEQQRWLIGPQFLWQPEKEWPAQPLTLGEIPSEDVEVKKEVNVYATTITDPAHANTVTKLQQHYSSCYRLKKAVAVYMRVKAVFRERSSQRMNDQPIKLNEDHSPLTVQGLEDAELAIIRFTQFQSFQNELRTLEQASNNKLKHEEQSRSKINEIPVGKTSSIYRLDPFMVF